VDGHQEGQGTCQYASGMLYEGQWRKGLRRVASWPISHPELAGNLQAFQYDDCTWLHMRHLECLHAK